MALVFLFVSVFAMAEDPDPLNSLKDRVSYLSNQEIREASPEENRLWNYFEEFLSKLNLDAAETTFSDPLIGHSFSRMLRISGDNREPQLILFFPINGVKAVENLLVASAVLQQLHRMPPAVSYEIVVSGSADTVNHREGLAIDFLLRDLRYVENKALVYVDATDEGENLLQTIVAGINSPIWMIRSMLETSVNQGFSLKVRETRPSFFRFFLEGREGPLDELALRGLRSIRLSWSQESPEKVGRFLAQWVSTFPEELTRDWDRHFVMFGQGTDSVILDQRSYIIFLVVFLLGVILTLFFLRSSFDLHLQALAKGFWQVGVYFSIVLLFTYISTLSVTFLRDQVLPQPNGWTSLALYFLFAKLFFFFLLYSAFIIYTKRLPLYRWSVFYQAAAVFLYVVYSVVAIALNFGFSFFFIWSLLLSILFIIVPFRPLKIILLLLLPLWPVYSLVQTFFNEVDIPLLGAVLFDQIEANLVMTLYFLPILFLFHAYHFQRHQKFDRNEPLQVSLLFFASSLGLFAMTFMILNTVVPRSIYPDLLEIVPPAANLSTITVDRATDDDMEKIERRLGASIIGKSEGELWRRSERFSDVRRITRQKFLNRYVFGFRIFSKLPAYRYEVTLRTEESPLVVLQSNFPFEQREMGKSIHFLIGRYPPTDLTLNFVLQGSTSAEMDVVAKYYPHPDFLLADFDGWNTRFEERTMVPLN